MAVEVGRHPAHTLRPSLGLAVELLRPSCVPIMVRRPGLPETRNRDKLFIVRSQLPQKSYHAQQSVESATKNTRTLRNVSFTVHEALH
jgi:hypothetical protein